MTETTPPLLRGGALLARALVEKGVEHVFTLAGGFCNPALEGFMDCGTRVINCPHEQVAGHLADAHTVSRAFLLSAWSDPRALPTPYRP